VQWFCSGNESWDFINIFNRRETGVHRQAKHFELNFFKRKTFL